MIDLCANPVTGFISSMTGFVDCRAEALGSGAWQTLATPGSTLMVVLTGFLTITIALIGYKLLLGEGLSVRTTTLTFVKIGAVFALATSWPAYRTLVYDLIIQGPTQLFTEIGPRAELAGADGTLLQRLDAVDQGLAQLSILGVGNPPANAEPRLPPPFGGFDAFALGGARIAFEMTSIAGLASVRLVAGLMLALGPFFIAFLMFDSTRSLFEGWVRVLTGAALGSLGVMVVLGLELGLLEPWLSDVLGRRMAGEALPTISTELFVIAGLFGAAILAVLLACTRVTSAFRLSALVRTAIPAFTTRVAPVPATVPREPLRGVAAGERTRVAELAALLKQSSSRERLMSLSSDSFGSTAGTSGPRVAGMSNGEPRATPVGRSFTKRTSTRISAGAARRDQRG